MNDTNQVTAQPAPLRFANQVVHGNRFSVLIFIVGVGLFYWLTAAGNLSETDDVYAFAYRAENFPLTQVSDPRLMLYHMSMRTLYLTSSALSLGLSSLILMRLFSVVCAAISLLLFLRILVLDFKLSTFSGTASTLLLGITYGFWRYAAEAEVYIPAIMLCLFVFRMLVSLRSAGSGITDPKSQSCNLIPESSANSGIPNRLLRSGTGVVAGLTVLFYQPSVIPLFFAFPILLIAKDRCWDLSRYLLYGLMTVIAGYIIGYMVFWGQPLSLSSFKDFLSQRSHEFAVSPMSLKTVVVSVIRSGLALSHDITATNWVFGFGPIEGLIRQAFSNNVISEEVFLAQRCGWLIYLPLATMMIFVFTLVRLYRAIRPLRIVKPRDRRAIVILVWLLANTAVIGRLNSAGIEAWIMVLPPLVIVFAHLIIEPCVRLKRERLAVFTVAILFVHNAVGGMLFVASPANEYDKVKGAWVIEHATSRDLIVVSDNAGLAETMRYLSQGKVALIRSVDAPYLAESLLEKKLPPAGVQTRGRDFYYSLAEMLRENANQKGRIILFDDIFQPSPYFPADVSVRAEEKMLELKNHSKRVYESSGLGATFIADCLSLEN